MDHGFATHAGVGRLTATFKIALRQPIMVQILFLDFLIVFLRRNTQMRVIVMCCISTVHTLNITLETFIYTLYAVGLREYFLLTGHYWNDIRCSNRRPFVCVRKS